MKHFEFGKNDKKQKSLLVSQIYFCLLWALLFTILALTQT